MWKKQVFYPPNNRIFLLTLKKEYAIVKNVFGKAKNAPGRISRCPEVRSFPARFLAAGVYQTGGKL